MYVLPKQNITRKLLNKLQDPFTLKTFFADDTAIFINTLECWLYWCYINY